MVVVVLVLALLAGTIAAAEARTALKPDRTWVHINHVFVHGWITSHEKTGGFQNVWGILRAVNKGNHKVVLNCLIEVWEGRYWSSAAGVALVLPAAGWKTGRPGWRGTHWYAEGPWEPGKLHGYYSCEVQV